MNLADLLKKNFVLVPVVASVLVGTFTGVRYVVNLKTNFCRIYLADGRKFIQTTSGSSQRTRL